MLKKKLILIADDEVGIHESLRIYLTREGYEVYSVFRGDDVMEAFTKMRPDLVILDIMMPGRSGTQVCADIRAISMTPIIMLTAKGEEVDKLLGFALGADDYLVKPFETSELFARIRALSRRGAMPLLNETTQLGDLLLNRSTRTLTRNSRVIQLTGREFQLLDLLMQNNHQVLTREILLDRIWGLETEVTPNTLDAYVRLLRKKIEQPGEPELIENVRGVGYRLAVRHV